MHHINQDMQMIDNKKEVTACNKFICKNEITSL